MALFSKKVIKLGSCWSFRFAYPGNLVDLQQLLVGHLVALSVPYWNVGVVPQAKPDLAFRHIPETVTGLATRRNGLIHDERHDLFISLIKPVALRTAMLRFVDGTTDNLGGSAMGTEFSESFPVLPRNGVMPFLGHGHTGV
jgi:hypothetical protein